MPYEFLPHIAIADVAFRATGKTVEEMFAAAARATTNVMVDDLSTVNEAEKIQIDLSENSIEMLLFDFLNELVYLKDTRQLLLLPEELKITSDGSRHRLLAMISGERIDPAKHPLNADVKAVTLHRFEVKATSQRWEATVVLDI